MKRQVSVSVRILLLSLGLIAWMVLLFGEGLRDSRRLRARLLVQTAAGVLQHHAELAQKQVLTLEAAQQQAKAAIKAQRYANDDGFWISDQHQTMLMHTLRPELEGRDLSAFTDPHGKALFNEMAAVCRQAGGGFVDYDWQKPGSGTPVPMISYVQLFPDWGWIVGTGIPRYDLTADEQRFVSKVRLTVMAAAIVAGLGLLFSLLSARSIGRLVLRIAEGLRSSAEQVKTGAAEVAQSSQSLAEGASEQAASIEQTCASMQELSAMTQQNSGNAKKVNALMGEVNHVVDSASQSMGRLTDAMGEISRAGEESAKIIKTIDEIAFQTNLLALNAAVEAARAGEAGAGFAVVADEVRNLAMRAAEAAKNTAELIDGTVRKVQDGAALVARTNADFNKVAESAGKVAGLIDEISAVSVEQAQGIGQVNTAVAEMNKVTQQNAAHAEESAAASEQLSEQADQVMAVVAELDVLVAGSQKRTTAYAAARTRPATGTTPITPVFSSAGAAAFKTSGRPAGAQPKPAQLIPLDDAELSDF
jgi:methyl-accepting chemotaxis protein